MSIYYQDDSVTLYQQRDDESPTDRRRRLARETTRRYRLRQKGVDVPLQPRPRGYKQSPELVAKRSRSGEAHHAWIGDAASKKVGRKRALRRYPEIGPCSRCGSSEAERHHIDEDALNNEPSNIEPLCRACHVDEHRQRSAP